MTKLKLSAAIALVATMGAGYTQAQSDAASVELGNGIEFTPSVTLGLVHDDNVANTEVDPIESWVTVLTPSFVLSAGDGVSEYSLGYTLSRGQYQDTDEDDYTDHALEADASWILTARNRFALGASYVDEHEERGTSFSQGFGDLLDEVDRYTETDAHGVYTFGAEGARGNIELEAGISEREYDDTLAVVSRDRDMGYGSARFFYNTGGKTRLLAEVNRRNFDYVTEVAGTARLDSTETDLLVGVTWEGTAKTTGSVKVGSRRKQFDDGALEDATSPAWEIGVRWQPLTYSAFELSTERGFEEPRGAGDFAVVNRHSLGWGHSWAERFSTEAAYFVQETEYEGIDRNDDFNGASVRFNYEMRRWLTVSAGVTTSDRDSNIDGLGADRTITSLSLQATL